MKEVKTKVNSTLTLECECWAVPPPSISWYKDGRVSAGLQTALDSRLCTSPAQTFPEEPWKNLAPELALFTLQCFILNKTKQANTFQSLSYPVHPFASSPLLRSCKFGLTKSPRGPTTLYYGLIFIY